MKRLALAGVAAGVLMISPAIAAISGSDIVHDGAGDVPACASCHGADGAGQAGAGIPRIGGMDAGYLAHELESAASGARDAPVMSPVAKLLSAAQIEAVAAYYARQSPPPSASASTAAPQSLARGRYLAQRGDWAKGVPSCQLCHGADGAGVGSAFPRLAGQHMDYIEAQLKDFRQGSRHDDPMGLMTSVAKRLDEQQIADAAGYFSALPKLPALPALPATKPDAAPLAADGSFSPPPDSAIANDEFGAMVRQGQNIFLHTKQYAPQFSGNALSCSNCHLDAGRLAFSAPLWAAYVTYPAYRAKNKHVNGYEERMQGCFKFSMNGKAPPYGDKTLLAITAYSFFLATGAPTNTELKGRGYAKPAKPALPMDFKRGEAVYAAHCALCHGADGQGQRAANGTQAFPPLWGGRSFNWGAGMGDIKNAAGFIKANMPLSQGGTLSDQDVWDVAMFVDSHERPQDPRFAGSVEQTRKKYHDGATWMYGRKVNGEVLGSHPSPSQP